IDDEPRIGVTIDYRGAGIDVAPAQYVDRKIVLYRRARNAVEAWVSRVAVAARLFRQHDADTGCTRRLLPFGDDIGHGWIVRVDRLDHREAIGMGALYLHLVTWLAAGPTDGG